MAAAAEAAELLAILEEVRRLRRRSISIHRSEDWFCRNRSRIGPSSLGGRAARAPERPSLGCRCERRCVRAPAMWMYARVYCTCYIKWTTKFTPCSKRSIARSSGQHPRGSAPRSIYKALRDQHPARGVLAYLRARERLHRLHVRSESSRARALGGGRGAGWRSLMQFYTKKRCRVGLV